MRKKNLCWEKLIIMPESFLLSYPTKEMKRKRKLELKIKCSTLLNQQLEKQTRLKEKKKSKPELWKNIVEIKVRIFKQESWFFKKKNL